MLPPSAVLFDVNYYDEGCGLPYERSEHWTRFFGAIADHLVRTIGPQAVLDAGCAKGFLVEALRDRGVEAYGLDISEYAIGQVREDIKPFCRVASVADPLPRRYDLIVCIEILEHVSPEVARQAVDNFCQATDDIVFSSSPVDYSEATHFNVRPPEYWAELFAQHDFVRDVDFDVASLPPWATRFRRRCDPWIRVMRDYERRFWPLWQENQELRRVNVELRRKVDGFQAEKDQIIRSYTAEAEKIKNSPGWLLLEALGPLRRWGMPPGSRRERMLLGGLRRLRSLVKPK
jgi:hypothetical protein